MIKVMKWLFNLVESLATGLGFMVMYLLLREWSTVIANIAIVVVIIIYVVTTHFKNKVDKMFNEIWKEGIKSVDEIDVEELAKAFKNTISKAINNG